MIPKSPEVETMLIELLASDLLYSQSVYCEHLFTIFRSVSEILSWDPYL